MIQIINKSNKKFSGSREIVLSPFLENLKKAIRENYDFWIIGHSNPLPDGDSLCSSAAMAHFIKFLRISENPDMPIDKEIRILSTVDINAYANKVISYVEKAESDSALETYGVKNLSEGPKAINPPNNYELYSDINEHRFLELLNVRRESKNKLCIIVVDTDLERTGVLTKNIISTPSFINRVDMILNLDHHDPSIRDNFEEMQNSLINIKNVYQAIDSTSNSTSELILDLVSYTIDDKEKYWSLIEDYIYEKPFENFKKEIDFTSKAIDDFNDFSDEIRFRLYCIAKIVRGGISTDTGLFTYNNSSSTFITINRFLNAFSKSIESIDLYDIFNVDQYSIESIAKDRKDVSNARIYSTLTDKIGFRELKDKGLFIYLIIDRATLSNSAIKPIHVLQEYKYDVAVALTKDDDGKVKVELRSMKEIYNCRNVATEFPNGGGHIQAAGFTIEVKDASKLLEKIFDKFNDNIELDENAE